MTFYETLKETTVNGRHICAERHIDKYSSIWEYEIIDTEAGYSFVAQIGDFRPSRG